MFQKPHPYLVARLEREKKKKDAERFRLNMLCKLAGTLYELLLQENNDKKKMREVTFRLIDQLRMWEVLMNTLKFAENFQQDVLIRTYVFAHRFSVGAEKLTEEKAKTLIDTILWFSISTLSEYTLPIVHYEQVAGESKEVYYSKQVEFLNMFRFIVTVSPEEYNETKKLLNVM